MLQPLSNYDLLIVSDLHLSEGRNRFTNKLSLNEDFFFDEEFARFLQYHAQGVPGRAADRKWHLIINGDFLDFLQVTSTDRDEEFESYLNGLQDRGAGCDASPSGDHPFGFGTGPRESAFKVWTIMTGHWIFFEALAEFIAGGHLVSVGRGNHDVEFFYPLVQQTFIEKLRRIYDRKLVRSKAPDRADRIAALDSAMTSGGIRFLDWFYYEKGVIWAEHGNQYDELNVFKYWLCPSLPKKLGGGIDMPWGSFFVRYLFNRVEMEEPFADNIKPSSRFIGWFLTTHPTLALQFVFHTGRHMLSKMARAWMPVSDADYAESAEQHRCRLAELSKEAQIAPDLLANLDARRARSVMKEPSGRWAFIGSLVRRWRLTMLLAGALVDFCLFVAAVLLVGTVVTLSPANLPYGLWIRTSAFRIGVVVAIACLAALGGFVLRVVHAPDKPKIVTESLSGMARVIADLFQVRYVVMGHTHDSYLEWIGNGCEYFNTGTWTKVFSQEERVIREENEFVFVQGMRDTDTTLRMRLMKWVDGANEPRLVKIFDRSGGAPRMQEPVHAKASAAGK